jgi:uncharacterized protein YbaP (TraB family)
LRRRFARILAAALMLVLPAASIAEEAPHATPALWRVKHGASTLYLFGSLHILPDGYAWRTPAINAALDASDLFIFEVATDEAAIRDEKEYIVHNGILPRRQSLRTLLTPTEFETYATVLRRAGLRPEQFERYRPWLAAVMVGLAYLHRHDLTSLKGADDELMAYARDHGRRFIFLESMKEQMDLLTSGEERGHLVALKNLIGRLGSSRQEERELLETWSKGDAGRFTAFIDSYFKDRPEAQEFLIDRRNRNWLASFKQFLDRDGGTTMATVGAAHIGGSNGLVALLCREGYEVSLLSNANPAGENACAPGA